MLPVAEVKREPMDPATNKNHSSGGASRHQNDNHVSASPSDRKPSLQSGASGSPFSSLAVSSNNKKTLSAGNSSSHSTSNAESKTKTSGGFNSWASHLKSTQSANRPVAAKDTFAAFKKQAKDKEEKQKLLQDQQEQRRLAKEQAERERMRAEQERAKDRQGEEALERIRRGSQGVVFSDDPMTRVDMSPSPSSQGSASPAQSMSQAERERARRREQERRRREAVSLPSSLSVASRSPASFPSLSLSRLLTETASWADRHEPAK